MAEIKFNFYNLYKNYYKNINNVEKYNLYMHNHYELYSITSYFMELMNLTYVNKLTLYVLYELSVTEKFDYIICKSLKQINSKKIKAKIIFKYKNCFYKIYSIFKY